MPSLSLPIANRRVAESPPPAPQPEPAQQQRVGFRASVREFFKPLLPIPAKTTRSVNLAPPELEPELKSPTMSGGTTRRAASSSVAGSGSPVYLVPPSAASAYSVSSGNSPALSPMVRTTRVQFAASPVSVKEYTPHDSQLSPWASPSALTPTGVHLIQEASPPSSYGGSPSHIMAPLALFAPGSSEVRGAPAQQVLVPGNQVVGAARAPQVPTVRVGQPVLPAGVALPAGAVQGQRQTLTFLVPPAPASTVTMGQPTMQVVQQHPIRPMAQQL